MTVAPLCARGRMAIHAAYRDRPPWSQGPRPTGRCRRLVPGLDGENGAVPRDGSRRWWPGFPRPGHDAGEDLPEAKRNRELLRALGGFSVSRLLIGFRIALVGPLPGVFPLLERGRTL